MTTSTKTCSRCQEEKPLEEFPRRARSSDGRAPACSSCVAVYYGQRQERIREVRRDHYERVGRDQHRLKRYGLTPEAFAALLTEQGSRCAICRSLMVEEVIVDHDHETGRVRGLLCRPCNSGIGHLGDDPARVRAALAYLEES